MANEIQIAGLGAMAQKAVMDSVRKEVIGDRPLTPTENKIAEVSANEAVKNYAFNDIKTEGMKFLDTQVENLNPYSKGLAKEKRLRYEDKVIYIRKRVDGKSGIQELFENSDDKVPGITNLSQQKLSDGENLAVERIEVNFAPLAASMASASDAKFKPLEPGTSDAILLNSELELSSEGNTILRLPLNKFVDTYLNGAGQKNGYNLKSPRLIKEKETIQIRLLYPNGSTTAVTTDQKAYIDVALIGAGTKPAQGAY